MLKNKKDHFIARHILEIKLKNRIFSFVDFRGELGDFVIDKMAWSRLRLSGARVDISNEKLDKVIFFSWENCGFQIEAAEDFSDFNRYTQKFIEIIEAFSQYQILNISRIGVKSSIFFHKKNIDHNKLKAAYKRLMFNDITSLEQSMDGKIVDIGLIGIDMEAEDSDIRFTTGPMTKEEVNAKVFQNKYYEDFQSETGIYFDIDVSRRGVTLSKVGDLKDQITSQVSVLESKWESFLEYLTKVLE